MWINESEIAPYLKDVRKIKVLSQAEEDQLIQQIKEGSEKAAERLICSNLRFVITVAKEYQNQGLEFKDLICEGNYGLIKAARRFDSAVGVKFYSYAVWWVRQAIMQALNEHSRTVRLPVNVINNMSRNRKSMSEQEYSDWCAAQSVNRTHSLNQHMTNDGEEGEELINMLVGEENSFDVVEEQIGLSDALHQVMSILTERERDIIMQSFGIDGEKLTLQQIADDMQLTKERVRQVKNQAIKKLRYNAPLLFKFFD